MTSEPVLGHDDLRVWDRWRRTAAVHARTRAHARRVDSALRLVESALHARQRPALSWSGGKDSTVMTHLVRVRLGADVEAMSEKDDLDYPGEEQYVRELAAAWGLRLRIVRPDVSPSEWIAAHAAEMHPGDELHARSAGLSKACFYRVMERANADYDLVMLGLRTEESGIRRGLRRARGRHYTIADGTDRALPVADWTGLDVYAYAEAHGIDLLPLYRCVGFMHADEPWTLRKSWWLPGTGARFGQIAWLRRYYPSLYRRLCEWMPAARGLA